MDDYSDDIRRPLWPRIEVYAGAGRKRRPDVGAGRCSGTVGTFKEVWASEAGLAQEPALRKPAI
ncbi:hypothetical protein GCM10010987_43870 [Bradyrhizobium guangdongense]|uniref:Uncharacterized protein n=1 Tax=Bradyrhizobium guangdongense TaxID=1325090 RepID=A0AA87W7D7_9BRAD|nr:hypothetical protein GCM10010987_43870 [Bradyrhizobium guangdongense]